VLERGAERFGWSKRTMAPQSMRGGDGNRSAGALPPALIPASLWPTVRVSRLRTTGGVLLRIGGHEMGQGIRTALAAAVARKLAVPPEGVVVLVGGHAGRAAARDCGLLGYSLSRSHSGPMPLKRCSRHWTSSRPDDRPIKPRLKILKFRWASVAGGGSSQEGTGQPDTIYDRLAAGLPCVGGLSSADFVTYSYIAHFVEVSVEPGTRRIRVPRVVSVADCGRVISPGTAASQVRGGVVWGIGATLREASEVDPRYGGFLNADLAEYVLP